MQKTIRGKLYDTDTATLIAAHTDGCYGDPAGYEEKLFCTPEGFYFLYGCGGELSPYDTEVIRAVSKTRAEALRAMW